MSGSANLHVDRILSRGTWRKSIQRCAHTCPDPSDGRGGQKRETLLLLRQAEGGTKDRVRFV
eukprot:6187984-Pleurochrysis_carterae.AAC.3